MLTPKQEAFAQAVASGMKAFYVYELIVPSKVGESRDVAYG